MRYRMMMVILATVLLFSGQALAADMKIGYVDVKSAIENTKAYRDGLKRLEGMKNQKQKELSGLRDKITKAEKDLFNQSMAMSPDMASRKKQDLNDLKKQFQRKQQDARESLMMEKNRLDQGVLRKFYDSVRAYGKSHHYDMILPTSSIIYGADGHDITSKVTQALDKGDSK
ncbi:MAG TPA: OmpH family outer membrane protein [Mariprofundaceae bacterium]|nr:OmpH family outer membrane protein [Mariprofundaceae bacterium]